MLSCKQAVFLIEKREAGYSLNVIEQIRLKFHLSMCQACKGYGSDSKHLEILLRKPADEMAFDPDYMTKFKKSTIKKVLDKKK